MSTTTTTTYVFDAASRDAVMAAYAAGDTSEKARIRAAHNAAKDAAMAAVVAATGDPEKVAEAVNAMADVASYVFRTEKSHVVRDYAADAADRIAELHAAIDAIESGNVVVPEGATVPTPEAIAAALSARGLAVEKVNPTYVTLSGRKATRARDGAVADYIVAALSADDAPDAMTAAMIAKSSVETDDYIGDARPSVGAIGAAFGRGDERFTGTTVNGTVAAKLV